jgi:peptidoglycan/LPS O-acetylase OafA/YrhL
MTHLWSLSVEEQFYLVWPWMVALGIKCSIRRQYLLLGFFLCLAPAFRVFGKFFETPLLGYQSFLTQFDLLGWGCALAITTHRFPAAFESICIRRPVFLSCLGLFLVYAPVIMVYNNILGVFTLPFRFTLTGVGVSMLLIVSIFNHSRGIWKLLNLPVVCWLGVLSYSLYIWHRPFTVPYSVFGFESAPFMDFPALLLSSLILAAFSYHLFELPLLKFRKRLRKECQPLKTEGSIEQSRESL